MISPDIEGVNVSSSKRRKIDLMKGTLSKHRETSKTYRARRGSYSQKTTIPDWVANLLDVRPGDEIEWQVIFNEDVPNAVIVSKKEDPE